MKLRMIYQNTTLTNANKTLIYQHRSIFPPTAGWSGNYLEATHYMQGITFVVCYHELMKFNHNDHWLISNVCSQSAYMAVFDHEERDRKHCPQTCAVLYNI